MVCETDRLEDAYDRYGNVAYVDHWFKCDAFARGLRIAAGPGKKIKITGKPDWWAPPYRVDGHKFPLLEMDIKLDSHLVTKNGQYPKVYPPRLLDLERIARKEPRKDWRVELIFPHFYMTYQRQGRNKWVLIDCE